MTKENKQILITGGVLLLAYFGIVRPILTSVGIFKSAKEKAEEKEIENKVNKQITDLKKKQTPTKTAAEWQIIAEQIYKDLRYSALDDDKKDAAYQIARVKNDIDFWTLYKSFGKRREYLFGIPAGAEMDLPQFIRSNLSTNVINVINDNYKRKNIKFRY
jgi:hypothetical protein